jgi:hypothetical protein
MPTTEVELDYRHKSFDRIFDLGHRKEGIGMRHEAGLRSIRNAPVQDSHTYFVILSSIDLGSRMNVGSVTRERSAPGRS